MGCLARRRIPAVFLFIGVFVAYFLRVSVSTTAQIPPAGSKIVTMYSEFDWDGETQGAVLSAFYYGYVLTQIPGAFMASRFGGTRVFAAGIFLAGIGTLLTPLTADRVWLLIVARVLTGFGEGVTYPAMATLVSKWAPASEKSATMAFCSSASAFSTACSLVISSEVMTHFGWRSVYWGSGVLVFVWLVPFRIFVYDSPEECPGITPEELSVIHAPEATTSHPPKYELVEDPPSPMDGVSDDDNNTSFFFTVKRDAYILFRHLKRPALWALALVTFAYSWMFYMILTELPSYFASVMDFSVQESNTASFLPWVAIFVTGNATGFLCDWLINNGVLSRLCTRRIFVFISLVLSSTLLVATTYMHSNIMAITCMTAAMGVLGLIVPLWSVNALELGGEHGGLTYAFVLNTANLSGIIAPLVSGLLTDALGLRPGFTAAFWLAAGLNVVSAVIYVLFASVESEPQLNRKKTGANKEENMRTTHIRSGK